MEKFGLGYVAQIDYITVNSRFRNSVSKAVPNQEQSNKLFDMLTLDLSGKDVMTIMNLYWEKTVGIVMDDHLSLCIWVKMGI